MGTTLSLPTAASFSMKSKNGIQYDNIPDMCGILSMGAVTVTGHVAWSKRHFFTLIDTTLSCWSVKHNRFIDSFDVSGSSVLDIVPKPNFFGRKRTKQEFRLLSNNIEWLLLKAPSEQDQSAWVAALKRITASRSANKGRRILQTAIYGNESDETPAVSPKEEIIELPISNSSTCVVHKNSFSGEVESTSKLSKQHSFVVLDESAIDSAESSTLDNVASNMNVSPWQARVFLMVYKWDHKELLKDWENDATAVLMKVGIDPDTFEFCDDASSPTAAKDEGKEAEEPSNEVVLCSICYEDHAHSHMRSLSCSHSFCVGCWSEYLNAKIQADKRHAIVSTCPSQGCKLPISSAIWSELANQNLYKDLMKFQKNLFVDNNESIQWCPSPGCGKAIMYEAGKSRDVVCDCKFKFCFQCRQGPHAPATCAMAKLWREQVNETDLLDKSMRRMVDKTDAWMASNTRPCPQCKCPIQKNHGCNHMTCVTSAGGCGYEFCWVCMADWKTHGQSTGGFYQCNVYKKSATEATLAKLREEQSASLDNGVTRFNFFSQRFRLHLNAARFAIASRENLEQLARKLDAAKIMSSDELTYLITTSRDVEHSHNRLAWSYCFRFFMGEGLHMDLFEAIQGMAEFYNDMLHECVESANTLLHRPIATSKMAGAFRSHKKKVDLATPEALRALKELEATVHEMVKTNVIPEPKMTLDNRESDPPTMDIKIKDSCDYKAPWVCALCERSNSRDTDECEDCFQPRLIGDFRVRLDKIELIQGAQRRPVDQLALIQSDKKHEGTAIARVTNHWHSPMSTASRSPTSLSSSPSHLVGLGGGIMASPLALSNFNLNANHGDWACTRCTFINFSGLNICEMCDTRRI